jgi:hypothetical protein
MEAELTSIKKYTFSTLFLNIAYLKQYIGVMQERMMEVVLYLKRVMHI